MPMEDAHREIDADPGRLPTSPPPVLDEAIDRLAELVRGRRLFVLTGAGCSTESGIPDYRGPDGAWKRKAPMRYQEFVGSETARRRYWSRSLVGWQAVADARPNHGHRALARLEAASDVAPGALPRITQLVTQNVDGLHQKAGSRRVIDLHGRLDVVECLGCGLRFRRDSFQEELARLNPAWVHRSAAIAPDGDADLPAAPRAEGGGPELTLDDFRVPPCPSCSGLLKPYVVFFGENVPRRRTDRAFAALEASDAALVVGSSLMVWSGYRFARRAAELGKPVAAVNLGRTRADDELALKVEGPCGPVLAALAQRLSPSTAART